MSSISQFNSLNVVLHQKIDYLFVARFEISRLKFINLFYLANYLGLHSAITYLRFYKKIFLTIFSGIMEFVYDFCHSGVIFILHILFFLFWQYSLNKYMIADANILTFLYFLFLIFFLFVHLHISAFEFFL